MSPEELPLKELLTLFIDRSAYDQRHNDLVAQVQSLQGRIEALELATAKKRGEWINAKQLASAAMTVAFASLSITITVMLLLVNHLLHP